MSTLYEYYNTNDDTPVALYAGYYWRAQTFTPTIAHKITSVKLLLYRVGSPGTMTVGIRATDISSHPTGGNLCSGTIDGNSLTTNTAGAWYEITLGAGYNLVAGIKYAIVPYLAGGDASNCVYWRFDYSSPTYLFGCHEWSANGTTWTSQQDADFLFEDWGTVGAVGRSYGLIIG